jgi:hypothetical protein
MKIQIDLKSAVCGLIIGAAAMFVMGMDSGSSVGRYQISSGNGLAFIIDSQTGQSWAYNSGNGPRNDGNFFDLKNK